MNILNIYGFKNDEPQFFKEIIAQLIHPYGQYIIGMDDNLILDSIHEKSTNKTITLRNAAKALKERMYDLGMIDAWRDRHPTDRFLFLFYGT